MNQKVDRAPFAITSDGKLLANLAHAGELDPNAIKSAALGKDDERFIGVVLRPSERRSMRRRLENALLDVLARFFGRRAREVAEASEQGAPLRARSKPPRT